jgi:hypothetical protein
MWGSVNKIAKLLWWLRHGVATLGVRERTATHYTMAGRLIVAKKTVVNEVVGGRFTQVDGDWLVAMPMSETPLEAGSVIMVTVKSGKQVPFMVKDNGADGTIFAILTQTREFVYNGARTDR